MNVSELIEALKQMPPEKEVKISADKFYPIDVIAEGKFIAIISHELESNN